MLLPIVLLLGCPSHSDDTHKPGKDSSPETDDSDTGPADALAGECADDVHWGQFVVDATPDYAYVTGSVSDGVVPNTILTLMIESGGCTIWRRENPFCDPACGPYEACDFDGSCIPYPAPQDLGVVTVNGLLKPVSMDPVKPGYTYFNTSLPNPPWDVGAAVELATGGGVYEPVTLDGYAPQTMNLRAGDWILKQGFPMAVNWEPPTGTPKTEVKLRLQIDLHGITPSTIECIFDDDGSDEVPAVIVDGLMDLGITGFPNGDLTRRTADKADIGEGCVDFFLTSTSLATISIPGYTPCNRDEDCPKGETCNIPLQRCE